MNKVILTGNIGSELDVKDFQNSSVANFSLATTENVKKGDNWEEETTWHNVRMWNRPGLRPYLTKGARILVEGKLVYDQWKDKQTDTKRTKAVVEVTSIELLSSKKGQSSDGPY